MPIPCQRKEGKGPLVLRGEERGWGEKVVVGGKEEKGQTVGPNRVGRSFIGQARVSKAPRCSARKPRMEREHC